MPHITTRKTAYGFEYSIGSLPVARAVWFRVSGGKWAIKLIHAAKTNERREAYDFHVEVMKLKDVMGYLSRLMATVEPQDHNFEVDSK